MNISGEVAHLTVARTEDVSGRALVKVWNWASNRKLCFPTKHDLHQESWSPLKSVLTSAFLTHLPCCLSPHPSPALQFPVGRGEGSSTSQPPYPQSSGSLGPCGLILQHGNEIWFHVFQSFNVVFFSSAPFCLPDFFTPVSVWPKLTSLLGTGNSSPCPGCLLRTLLPRTPLQDCHRAGLTDQDL